jgi:P-type Ca2+ transporter type 2C
VPIARDIGCADHGAFIRMGAVNSSERLDIDVALLCERDADGVFVAMGTSRKGLTSEQAGQRLEAYGENVLHVAKPVPMWKRFGQHLVNMFALLLWVASALSFVSDQVALGWAIIAVILINAVFAFFQEFRAEKAVEALKKLLPPMAKVVRDGQMQQIEARLLVPGDLIVIEEGDLVSADSRLIYAAGLRVDNSALTGETEPVARRADGVCRAGGSITDYESMVFTGTTASLGAGRAVVLATGMDTEFGKIAGLTQSVKPRLSPLQLNIIRLSRLITLIALVLGVVFFLLGRFIVQMSITESLIFAIGIIVANVPEGLLPTLTMALSVSTQRMAKRHVLVKKLSSVETLGSTTVICTDKTGTLTANQMTVREVFVPGRSIQVGGIGYEPTGEYTGEGGAALPAQDVALDACLRAGALCNNARLKPPSGDVVKWGIVGDPTEAAMLVSAAKRGMTPDDLESRYPRLYEHPFDSSRKRMTVVVEEDGDSVGYIKGAPREVIERCTHVMTQDGPREFTQAERDAALEANDAFALEALRVIAMATRSFSAADDYKDIEVAENGLTFLGLEAMQDPPRPEVEEAVKVAHTAGIRIIMITGDYGLTAAAIARKIGLIHSDMARIITGTDLEAMDDDALREAIHAPEVVFARVVPEHKMRIAQALQASGEVVAMTGDGVNDAPALKAADIGVAMGVAGTDVAREAADMILTDDNFASIVAAVEEGRAIFDNIRRFLTYFQTSNVAEMIPFIFMIFFRVPLPLTLMQILTIDLLTDQVPALALGLERPEPDTMSRPPRRSGEPILTWPMIAKAYLWLGPMCAAIGLFGFFFRFHEAGWIFGQFGLAMKTFGWDSPAPGTGVYMAATTMTLTGIVMAQVGNAFAVRTHRASVFRIGLFTNKMLLWGIAAELLAQAALVYFPPLQAAFGTAPLSLTEWLVLAALAPTLWFADELRKLVVRTLVARTTLRTG